MLPSGYGVRETWADFYGQICARFAVIRLGRSSAEKTSGNTHNESAPEFILFHAKFLVSAFGSKASYVSPQKGSGVSWAVNNPIGLLQRPGYKRAFSLLKVAVCSGGLESATSAVTGQQQRVSHWNQTVSAGTVWYGKTS
jgi:hypothetical protein